MGEDGKRKGRRSEKDEGRVGWIDGFPGYHRHMLMKKRAEKSGCGKWPLEGQWPWKRRSLLWAVRHRGGSVLLTVQSGAGVILLSQAMENNHRLPSGQRRDHKCV